MPSLQGFAAHNGEILAAVHVPSVGSTGSVIVTGGHDWQVCLVFPACAVCIDACMDLVTYCPCGLLGHVCVSSAFSWCCSYYAVHASIVWLTVSPVAPQCGKSSAGVAPHLCADKQSCCLQTPRSSPSACYRQVAVVYRCMAQVLLRWTIYIDNPNESSAPRCNVLCVNVEPC